VSRRVHLRPFSLTHADRLVDWVDSPSFLLQWAGPVFTYPLDATQLRDHLDETADPEPSRMAFEAVDGDDEMVGYLELNRIDRDNRSASVSRVIVAPGHRGHGYGASMVEQLLEIGFESVGLHRIELRVFDFNESALACYERVGFTREGVHRDARRHGDEYWSLVQMSILEPEWRAGGSTR
jgi:RimJ/RimL family protein N-acetyltransferase